MGGAQKKRASRKQRRAGFLTALFNQTQKKHNQTQKDPNQTPKKSNPSKSTP